MADIRTFDQPTRISQGATMWFWEQGPASCRAPSSTRTATVTSLPSRSDRFRDGAAPLSLQKSRNEGVFHDHRSRTAAHTEG